MKKDISLYIRISNTEYDQLRDLIAATVRNKSDMVRFLIREKHAEMFGGESAATETEPVQPAPVQ